MRAGNDQQAVEGCTQRWLDQVQERFSVTTHYPGKYLTIPS